MLSKGVPEAAEAKGAVVGPDLARKSRTAPCGGGVGILYLGICRCGAGGGQFYVLRGLGDFWGFVAGWAVLLDFTIDISLFALASAGYLNFFFPVLDVRADLLLLGLHFPGVQPILILEATLFVVLLTLLNILGVRESSRFNEILGALDIISESSILFIGFLFAFDPALLIHQMVTAWPDPYRLAYGASLAIISFVGLESISQASQETIRPGTVVPRTSIAPILTVLIYALAFSNLGLAMLPWQSFAEHNGDPVAWLASLSPNAYDVLGNMYAFGAATAYMLVFVSLLVLRFTDPWPPRPFKVPLNIRRIAGPAWIVLGIMLYSWHRRRQKLPITKSVQRDWAEEQMQVYEDAGEGDLAEELRENLARKRRLHGEGERESRLPLGTKVLDVPLPVGSNGEQQKKRKGGSI